jgi:Flp pilus assembly protein TadD
VRLGRESDAKVLLDRSIQWGDPNEWEGRYLLGRIYVKNGDYKTAQRLFAEATAARRRAPISSRGRGSPRSEPAT